MALSDWTFTVGVPDAIGRDSVSQPVTGVNGTTGKSLSLSFSYDGSLGDLKRAVQSYALSISPSTAKRPFVAPGTQFTLPNPQAPTPPDPARDAWQAKREIVLSCQRGLAEKIPGYDQARLDQAIVDRDALWNVAYESIV